MRPEIPDALERRIDAAYERAGYSTASELVRDAVRQRVTVIEREGEHPPLVGLPASDADVGSGEGTQPDGGEQVTKRPFKDRTIQSETGIIYGYNPFNDTEVSADRFEQPMGNVLILGYLGSGKTVSANVQLRRELEERDDLRVVWIDPLGSGATLTEGVDSQRIRLTEDAINPLEVRLRSEYERSDQDRIHQKARVATAIVRQLPHNEYTKENATTERILEEAVKQTMERTSGEAAVGEVTFAEVREVVQNIADSPMNYTLGVERDQQAEGEVAEEAVQLLLQTRGLAADGDEKLKPLTRPTSFDIEDSRVTWIDLQDDTYGTGMIAAAETVFEQACTSNDPVIIALDESHRVLQSDYVVELMARMRHARRFNVGWHLIGQSATEGEFGGHQEEFFNLCDIKQLHQMEFTPKTASALDLSESDAEYVRQAKQGSYIPADSDDEGAETLLGVGGEWIPTTVMVPDHIPMTGEF